MIKHLALNKTLWVLSSVLALTASAWGLLHQEIYVGLMNQGFVAAQFSQDALTILVSLYVLYLTSKTTKQSFKEPIIIMGILGSLAYLYAIFSIERIYNMLYLFYLAILSSSFYSIVLSLWSFDEQVIAKIIVPKVTRTTTGVFSIVIGILFSILWISALLPLMRTGNQIDSLYSIYLLDLVFIMPAYLISALLTFRRNPLGYIVTPAMDILGIFVIFPLGLGELVKPLFGLQTDYQSMMMSFILAGLFLVGAVWQLSVMRVSKR